MTRRISKSGEKLIRDFEGLRLTSYLCSANVWTCGVGETGSDIKQGTVWTPEYAEQRFQRRLRIVEAEVDKMLMGAPRIPDEVHAVLCSMTFNMGATAMAKSSLVRKLRKGDLAGAFNEVPRWCHAGGQLVAGLVRRRAAEQALWAESMQGRWR